MSVGESPQGLLYVEMDCPPEMEAEFHAWYNSEHLPVRAAIPGFLRARRYTALVGAPRWLASYELASTAVLETPEYLSRSGPSDTAWTKRITSRVQVHRRVYELAWGTPDLLDQKDDSAARGLLAVRYRADGENQAKLDRWHDAELAPRLLPLPGVLSARRYRCTDPGPEQLVLYQLSDPWVTQSPKFAREWTDGWEAARAGLSVLHQILYIRILPVG